MLTTFTTKFQVFLYNTVTLGYIPIDKHKIFSVSVSNIAGVVLKMLHFVSARTFADPNKSDLIQYYF